MKRSLTRLAVGIAAALPWIAAHAAPAIYTPVTDERLRNPEPANWLQYRGNYEGWGYSPLDKITSRNVGKLTLGWAFATGQTEGHQSPPIVNNGYMYVTTPGAQVIALDAKTGTELWRYKKELPGDMLQLHPTNRGVALYGDKVYFATVDAHVVALDAKTGKMKWYYQFTPHDIHDWDAQEPPVLVDANWQGKPRKLLVQANRNGFFYVLDRTNGELLLGKQFLKKLNWAKGIGKDGKPILNDLPEQPGGEVYVCPGFQGGANWYSTSYNPGTGLYYFQALERCNVFSKRKGEWQQGKSYMGGTARPAPGEGFVKSVRALNLQTGEMVWDLEQGKAPATASAGLLSTASGLVFFGENAGAFMAADAATGAPLWQFPTNQVWKASPMTYVFDNKQYIAVAVGTSIMAFGLPD